MRRLLKHVLNAIGSHRVGPIARVPRAVCAKFLPYPRMSWPVSAL